MKARFRSGRPEGLSFFAFQDIITGTSGILIVIALFLSLNLDQVIQFSTDADASHQRQGDLSNILARVAALKAQLADFQKLPVEDAATLQRMIAQLETTVLALSQSTASQSTQSTQATDANRTKLIEYQKLLTAIQDLEVAERHAENRARIELDQLPGLENKVKDAQSRLQASRDRQNVLRLIPERSDTTKEPVLVLVQSARLVMQRFDGSQPHTANSLFEFMEALKTLSAAENYVVFYFKPSGAKHFESLTERVRMAGFEIGYDVVPENIEFEFR